jgi:regulator of PEP synthase PpsR (kinase-PPPase family)
MTTQLTVFAVSDGSGETAERLALSALTQFEGAAVEEAAVEEAAVMIIRRGEVRTAEQVRDVVREATDGGIILHTLVSDELRRLMVAESRLRGVDSLDLMGPMLDRYATHLHLTPQQKPGLFKQRAEAKSREIEAVEFTFKHDDGRNVHELDKAEIVLVGVSRTMKTPTTLYLAYRGWFAANVPIVVEVPPPATLLTLPKRRVFCLRMNPGRLREMRLTRAGSEAIPAETYASAEQIAKELRFCQRLCLEQGWQSIDVTGKSVEEVSREIIALVPTR